MKSIIVIPTYNEAGNLPKLTADIFSLKIPDLSLIIVDDNSPDKTGEVAENIKALAPETIVIHRASKSGLGSAYVEGFKKAIEAGADYIFEMDADLSHDFQYLPIFLKEIENADLVLGSRYVKGGMTQNWGLARRLISYLGNIYARLVLGVPVHDLTGGFKCYRRAVLEKINFNELDSQGYVFQVETSYLAYKNGFRIKEVPIVFKEREAGKSKFSLKIFSEAFIKVLMLRFKSRLKKS